MHLQAVIVFCLLGCVLSSSVQLSCNLIREFVDGHNERRLRLANGYIKGQPAASKMMYMIWDDELAAKATKWAARNQFGHNPNRSIGISRFQVGENIFMMATPNILNFEQKQIVQFALHAWFEEHKGYTYGPIRHSDFGRHDGVQIGHYTQMAWSNTMYVGCGMSTSKISQYYFGLTRYLIVCNYGPTGNYIGSYPYPTGSASRKLTCGRKDCSRPYGDKC